ncbi:MAG: class B sortase, partial [Clostridia bacterium]|nr:class B sortase [Clostridia bacterium]
MMQQNQAMPGENPYGQMPYPQMPFAPYQQPPQQVFDANGQNPGTRVLYQSADFEMNEKAPVQNEPVPEPVFRQEMDIEEETVPLGGLKNSPFSVDENEMTMFEFDAMAKKMKVPQYKKANTNDIDTEEEEIVFEKDDEAEEKPKKKLPTSEIIRRVVLTVSLVAIVISSGMLINEWRLSKQNDNIMEEVSGLIIDENENDPAKPEEDKELTPEQQWKKIKKEYPNVIFPEGMQVKYAKLYATNPEFVGYLSADGVNLNLPVVQSKDDRKYLEKNFYLQKTKYGCPFVTHLNNIDPLDQNTVIFGHHMNNGTIFGTLDAYKSIEGFKKAPVITFNTLYKDYKWKVIAAIVTNAYTKDDNGYIFRYYFTQLSTQENFSAYLSELSQRSLYDTGVDVLPTDKLLTLSTCSHEFTDARFVVIARLVRPGESADVDVSRATVNSNPRYPQAWYNKKGKTNPYKNAFQWEVS